LSKFLDVGKSWRTHAKHDLMNSFVGQEVGSTGMMPSISRLQWIDLTAGDALGDHDSDWHRSCSPGILAHHAKFSRKPVEISLYEIQPATYDRLLEHLNYRLPLLGYVRLDENTWGIEERVLLRAVNASGHLADITSLRSTDAVMVFNDPNAITEWAMRDTFISEIERRGVWCFRSLSTMGCNPAGLKRLSLDERRAWFDLIGAQQDALPRHRDLLLAAIERDEAQWAYLLCTAQKWRPPTESVVRTAFRKIGRTAAASWFRTERELFEETKRTLFLTKKERAEA
jgi:hypothetical protein